jgi:endonuclease/exonuclease/phosphatase family metal-dependent hydrolase
MHRPADRVLEAHPGTGPAWFLLLARVAGQIVRLPVVARCLPGARSLDAVTRSAGRVTVLAEPRPSPPAREGPLTVLSANLWHDWPRQQRWPQRLEAFARLAEAEQADILLVQEAARTPGMSADLWLARRLGMAVAYARANGDMEAIGFEEGPAVLSRFPLGEIHLRQLSHGHNPLARRVALGAHVDTPHGRLLVVSAHLGLLQRHNAGQIRRLRSWVADVSAGEVAVIGGDFNAPEHRDEIGHTRRAWTDTFRHVHPLGEAVTHTRRMPWGGLLHRRLDYVFVQQPTTAPWQVLESCHLDAPTGPHSDHRAVLARLRPVLGVQHGPIARTTIGPADPAPPTGPASSRGLR